MSVVYEDTSSDDEFFIGTIGTARKVNLKDWNVALEINKNITPKLDTGAQCNVMPLQIYNKLTNEKFVKSDIKLVLYTGCRMKTIPSIISHYRSRRGCSSFGFIDLSLVKHIYEVNIDEGPEQ